MKIDNLLDNIWKPIKATIYNKFCGGDYRRYLHLKSKFIAAATAIGLYENKHLQMLKNIVKSGDSAIDVGAHYGIYSQVLSSLVGKSGFVIALEPLPEVFEVLTRRMSAYPNVECINSAVSDGSITNLQLSVPCLPGGVPEPALASHNICPQSTYKVYTVDCIRLDQVQLKSKLSFIKIDVESHEIEVISGAAALIEKYKPIIQVEVSKNSFEAASNSFGISNYEITLLKHGKLESVKVINTEGIYYLRPI